MEYLMSAKQKCEYLIIGIANPDASLTKFTAANPHRSQPASNPLTYFERFQMISAAVLAAGVPRQEFDIVPFPINFPDILLNYVPRDAKYFIKIYDEWGLEKQKLLQDLGCDVESHTMNGREISSTIVRDCIIHDRPWKHFVPDTVYDYIIENKLDLRVRQIGLAAGK